MEIIHGIIVLYKQVGEKVVLVGILTDDSRYIKGYIQLFANEMSASVGQQVIAHMQTAGSTKFIIDSAENYMPALFWQDHSKLTKLMRVLNCVTRLPENVAFDGLYDKFLNVIAKMVVEEAVLDEWESYVHGLV